MNLNYLLQKTGIVVLFVWNLCVVTLLVSTAFTRYPGLHHDSALYSTPIINYAANGEWKAASYANFLVIREDESYNIHGQLYQCLFGKVLQCATYEKFFVWVAVLNTLSFLTSLIWSWRWLNPSYPIAGIWLASGISTVTALSCLYLQGRPEHLLPLLLLVPLGASLWTRTARFTRHIAYVILGLVVVLSPLPGVLCCMGVVTWIALNCCKTLWREIGLCAVISLTTAGLFIQMSSPVNPWQWVFNTVYAGNISGSNGRVFFEPMLFEFPLWNLFTLGTFGLFAIALIRSGHWWLVPLEIALIVLLLRKVQVYTFLGFLPVMMLAVISLKLSGRQTLPVRIVRLPVALVSCFSLGAVAALFRAMLLVILFCREGVSFNQTNSSVRQLERSLDLRSERIGYVWLVHPPFVVFSRADSWLISVEAEVLENKVDSILKAYEERHKCVVRYVLLPQMGHLKAPPPLLHEGEFRLETNGWVDRRATFLGLKLGGSMPGYQFALYRRVDSGVKH